MPKPLLSPELPIFTKTAKIGDRPEKPSYELSPICVGLKKTIKNMLNYELPQYFFLWITGMRNFKKYLLSFFKMIILTLNM